MIVIHIGLRKSGSTTLQYFLSANEVALRGIGVEYPRLGRAGRLSQTAHMNLQCELRGRSRIFDPARGTIDDVAKYWRRADAQTMILSCEGFEECPTNEAEILKTLARGDEEFRIVLIVRDLVSLMPSSYGQKIKGGMNQYDFDTFFYQRMKESRVNYFHIAENWASAFGWENLYIRVLDRGYLKNGDLIDEVLSIAGIDSDCAPVQAMARPGDANLTPGWRVLEAIRALYGGWHGLAGDHPLSDAASHGRDLRQDVGLCAIDVGERRGWNNERGCYLTLEQAQMCVDTYARAVEAINRRAKESLPTPLSLAARDFEARGKLPDSSLIKPGRLHAFYDAVARRLTRQQSRT